MSDSKARRKKQHSVTSADLLETLLDTNSKRDNNPGSGKVREIPEQAFNEYMMSTLQRSHEFMMKIGERNRQTINQYLYGIVYSTRWWDSRYLC